MPLVAQASNANALPSRPSANYSVMRKRNRAVASSLEEQIEGISENPVPSLLIEDRNWHFTKTSQDGLGRYKANGQKLHNKDIEGHYDPGGRRRTSGKTANRLAVLLCGIMTMAVTAMVIRRFSVPPARVETTAGLETWVSSPAASLYRRRYFDLAYRRGFPAV
ncbi:hypothetical protein NDU88_001814 [Pleurodeles waltl]|uniref:Uncharacterized protein n=1 Tax=Pleurodeles waltl TaxID=8319 RepID=A0AAV7TJB3_PLEWA|nr:hypothetical protein NDU88_001814 [Pleurodeles waltl]